MVGARFNAWAGANTCAASGRPLRRVAAIFRASLTELEATGLLAVSAQSIGTGVDVLYPKENTRLADQILALGGAIISEFPLGTFAHHGALRARAESRRVRRARKCHQQKFLGPQYTYQQGAKLVASWEDVWEELPENIRLSLTPVKADESQGAETASLFPNDDQLSPHERKIFALLKADEATHIDEIVERLEPDLSSSEIFAALFELELSGKVRQLPGKNFVQSF